MDKQEQVRDIPTIVRKNLDVEHIMLAACCYGIHGLGEENLHKIFSMLVATDIHRCPNQLRSAVEYLHYYEGLDCGICLGDMMGSDFAESDGKWYVNEILQSQKPFYTVLGNHDLGNSAKFSISATPKMSFEKFILPLKKQVGVSDLDRPYYKIVWEKYKIALIVLNAYDAPDILDEDGNYAVSRGKEMILQEQTDWLIQALQEIPAEYHLMVALHSYCFPHTTVDCDWTQDEKNLGQDFDCYGQLPDIIDAWKHGKALSKRYTPRAFQRLLSDLVVDCDFSARGKGDFVGYFVGHTHYDIIARSETYPDQNIVCFASSAFDTWQNYNTDLPRTKGTKSEDLLTVVSVHTQKRQIRLVRIGSNCTLDLVDRTKMIISY
ncbi:MAG: metallophosphoesterase [Clostridia bacterium]|nr:metallophosphoesterase [Clostridia bacterium]